MSDLLTAAFHEQMVQLSRVEHRHVSNIANDNFIEKVDMVLGIHRAHNPKRVRKCKCYSLGVRAGL